MPRPGLPNWPAIRESSTHTLVPVTKDAPMILIPLRPVLAPFMLRLRKRTLFLESEAWKLETLIITPVVEALRIELKISWQSMVIDLVMVTTPKPPGSRQLISPLTAVFEMAPANVLHGAVRLHGLASSPTPDTHVRDAWALATEVNANIKSAPPNMVKRNRKFFMIVDLLKVRLNRSLLIVKHGPVSSL